MIDNLKMSFPNQAIPSIFGESTSYLQQLSYIAYKLQQTIDEVNSMQAQGLPVVSAADNGKIAEVVDGEWRPTSTLATLSDVVSTLSSTTAQLQIALGVLNTKVDMFYQDVIQTAALLNLISQGIVTPPEEV